MNRRALFYQVIWRSGIPDLARRLIVHQGKFVVNFHGISSARRNILPLDAQPKFSAAELHQALEWIGKRFAFLTPDEFLHSRQGGVLLTFDDGFANNYTNALPVLAELRSPAIFFVTTQHVVQPRNWLPATRREAQKYWGDEARVPEEIAQDFFDGLSVEQLVACAQSPWITIGSHTVTHAFLTRCDPQALTYELVESRQYLGDLTGKPVDLFAYPTGDYSRAVAEAVRAAGYRAAFAVRPLNVGVPLYEIPRVDLYSASPAYLSLKLSGLHMRPIINQALL